MTIPALKEQWESYPEHFKGRVPKRIKMLMTVSPDFPFCSSIKSMAVKGSTYSAWTNSLGAVSAIIGEDKLGLKPDEFEVVDWYEQ